tara:strand:- start:5085 stop:5873 length:789 start_codon:yes stop_codon:yes gene_type:complete
MKKYLVIGNPIKHSLSPQLHNYWIKNNNINAVYEKKQFSSGDLQNLILLIKQKKIEGANITVPFKREIISYLDQLSYESSKTQSVNTVYLSNEKVVGHNTDIDGFELAVKDINYDVKNKKILILGAGGVVPSIIFALNKMKAKNILVTNRTISKARELKRLFPDVSIIEWGKTPEFDMIINATSLGLNDKDHINIDFSLNRNKFFYDVIYNPKETKFLRDAKKLGNTIENGRKMFIFQAAAAFEIWHGIKPKTNSEVNRLLD